MAKRTASVRNSAGIHCRPSAVIMKEMATYPGQVRVLAESGDTDLKSIYGLLSLALEAGTRLEIEVNGPEAEQWADKIVELFERHYDFPPLGVGETGSAPAPQGRTPA